jgi:LAS superfamily LD-carboxypeptidase LdcB
MPIFLALLVILTAGLGPGEEPEYVPAGSEAYVDDLKVDGYVNGKMNSDRLMTYGGCTLERDAAYLYSLMVAAAEEDGIDLDHEDCYRTYREQYSAYERRCPVTETPVYGTDANGQRVQTGVKRARECTGPPVAPAGRSNHGWGRAVDFSNGSRVLSCHDEEYHWLKDNAYRFGWVHPAWAFCGTATQEPWHWEWAGVTDPTLVDFTIVDPALIGTLE